MLKPWKTSLNKTPNKKGKRNNKKEEPHPSQKNKTQSGSQRGEGI
jgi:hypothetical protein